MNMRNQLKRAVNREFVHDEETCKKDEIINTARSLFYKNGYAKTSVNRIQKEAGVSKGLIYYHFKNKDDLALAVLQDVLDNEFIEYGQMVAGVEKVVEDKGEVSRIIDDYLNVVLASNLQNMNAMQLIFDLLLNLQSKDYKEKVKALYQGYIDRISDFLNSIGNRNADTNAKLILSILNGLSYINYTLGKTLLEKEIEHIGSVMKCIINLEVNKNE